MKKLALLVVYALIALKSRTGGQSVDLTLVSGAAGEDVVDASIQEVNLLPIFIKNDLSLLKRIALVESNFGLNQTVIQANSLGGIWQISSLIYKQITQDTSLPAGIDLSSDDFSVPLKSALAARLFIESIQNGSNIPGSIEDQAQWWSSHYHPGSDPALFIERVKDFENITQCNISKLDLWFVIDGSGSIGLTDFNTSLEFVNQTATKFEISPDHVRTGLMIYSSNTYFKSYLNDDLSKKNFSDVVLSTPYPGGGTSTGKAISEVYSYGFNITNGMRPLTEGVPRILVVLTDGKSYDNVTEPSNEIKADGIVVFAVGVGSGYNPDEVNEIATPGLAFDFTLFTDLLIVLKSYIAKESCKAPASIPTDAVVSLELTSKQTSYVTLSFPSNGSLELSYNLCSSGGSVTLYVSGSVRNPNSALYDLTFTLPPGETTVTINVEDVGGNPAKQSGLKRSKRQSTSSTTMTKIYMAMTSTGTNGPVQLDLTATPTTFRAVSPSVQTTTSSSPPLCNGIKTSLFIFCFWSLFDIFFM